MKEEISVLLCCFQSTVTCSHHGILWWVGVGLAQQVCIKGGIQTVFFRPSLWIYLVCLRYSLQNQNAKAFLLNHVTTAPVFPSVSPLFLLLLSLWRVFPISFVCPPPTSTCSISRMCDNRSGVNVNFQTYIISSLHNFTEAHTLTDRQTDTQRRLSHSAASPPLFAVCSSRYVEFQLNAKDDAADKQAVWSIYWHWKHCMVCFNRPTISRHLYLNMCSHVWASAMSFSQKFPIQHSSWDFCKTVSWKKKKP